MLNYLMRLVFCILVTLLVAPNLLSQSRSSFCDLLRNPEKYNGKEVTFRATYRYGFEWQELYCLDCLDKGRAWFQVVDDLDQKVLKALRKTPKGAGIVNVTVRGFFWTGQTYGHLNGYKYQVNVTLIKDVAVVFKGMIGKERTAEERWACGGSNPR